MVLCCTSFIEFGKYLEQNNKRIVMFGVGAIGQVIIPEILKNIGAIDLVDCYLDNNQTMWGKKIFAGGRYVDVRSPKYLNECSPETVILLNISRYSDVLIQLENMECTNKMKCFISYFRNFFIIYITK